MCKSKVKNCLNCKWRTEWFQEDKTGKAKNAFCVALISVNEVIEGVTEVDIYNAQSAMPFWFSKAVIAHNLETKKVYLVTLAGVDKNNENVFNMQEINDFTKCPAWREREEEENEETGTSVV